MQGKIASLVEANLTKVINDLGYELTSYRNVTVHPYICGTSETFTEFTFTPKDCETTEG